MMLTYAIGALSWGGVVLLLGGLAIYAGKKTTLADVVAAILMALVHGVFWPISAPATILGQAWRWWRGS